MAKRSLYYIKNITVNRYYVRGSILTDDFQKAKIYNTLRAAKNAFKVYVDSLQAIEKGSYANSDAWQEIFRLYKQRPNYSGEIIEIVIEDKDL